MGARDLSGDPVSVVVVFDRFPASVRGAVVVRGADGDPHQVTLASADAVEVRAPKRPVAPVSLDHATVDLAPREEMFVPFELPFADLHPGWYGVVAEVLVDGRITLRSDAPGTLFPVPWPSGTMRRGTIPVDRGISGAKGVRIDRVECKADRTVVRWEHPAGDEQPDLDVQASGRSLPFIEGSDRDGSRITVVYPIPKDAEALSLLAGEARLDISLT